MLMLAAPMFACALALSGSAGDVDAGVAAYRALEYEQAQAAFERALADPAVPAKERATLTLWLALVRAGLYDDAASEQLMQQAVALDREVALPVRVSRPIEERFARVKEAAATAAAAAAAAAAASAAASATNATDAGTATATAPGNGVDGVDGARARGTEGGGALDIVPLTLGGAGAVALLGAAALGGVTALKVSEANDDTRFASDRQAAIDFANVTLVSAVALGATSATLLGAAALFGVGDGGAGGDGAGGDGGDGAAREAGAPLP